MFTSRLACNFCKTTKTQPLLTVLPRYLATSIPKLTSPPLFMAQRHRSGELLNPSSHRKDRPPQLSEEQVGIVPWLRFAIQVFHLNSSTLTSNVRASVHPPSMLLRGPLALGKKLRGPMESRRALPQTVRVLQVLLGPHLLVLVLYAACHLLQRLTMSLRALTMLLPRNSLLNRFKRSHHLRTISSLRSLIASQTPTMVLTLAASLHLHRRRLPQA